MYKIKGTQVKRTSSDLKKSETFIKHMQYLVNNVLSNKILVNQHLNFMKCIIYSLFYRQVN